MPYTIKTRDGIVIPDVPDELAPDSPGAQALVMEQRAMRRKNAAQMALEGMGPLDRLAANVGAGVDSLITGAKQMMGRASEQDVAEKRERDAVLGDSVTGGHVAQFVGEAAPLALVPVAGGGAAAVASGAGLGAVSGALQPVGEGESRAFNTMVGGVVGGALPLAVKGIKAARGYLTQAGREAAVGEQLAGMVDDPIAAAARARAPTPADIPLSTAAQLDNAAMARLERTSRANPRTQPGWHEFDQNQGRAVWQSVHGATNEAEELAARKAARSSNWDANWAQAAQQADPQVFAQRITGLKSALGQAARSPEAVNPEVMEALKVLGGTIERLGDDLSPAHLQQLRAQFNGRVVPMAQNALKSAPRDNPAIISIVRELDDILNATTGKAWDTVRQGYAADSEAVRQAAGASKLRDAFMDPTTGAMRNALDAAGDVPVITQHGLQRAMDAARMPGTKEVVLSPQARQGLGQTMEALRRQGITQQVAKTATAGGGSNTAADLAGAAMHQVPGGAISRSLIERGVDKLTAQRQEVLAQALRDPQFAAQLIAQKAAQGGRLSAAELATLRAARMGPQAAVEVLQPRQ